MNVAGVGDLSTEVAGTPFMHVTTGASIIWQNTLDAGVSLEPSLKGMVYLVVKKYLMQTVQNIHLMIQV